MTRDLKHHDWEVAGWQCEVLLREGGEYVIKDANGVMILVAYHPDSCLHALIGLSSQFDWIMSLSDITDTLNELVEGGWRSFK